MKLENWESTADLNDIYADIRANDLEQCVAELDAFGFTVLPPEKVAPPEFHQRLRQAILDVHERRTAHKIDADGLGDGQRSRATGLWPRTGRFWAKTRSSKRR